MAVARDVYGFALRGVTDAEQKARAESLARARSQARTWSRTAHGAALHQDRRRKIKDLLRRGLPPELRAEIWLSLSGAAVRMAASTPGYYSLLTQSLSPREIPEVTRDVKERFQQHPDFSGSGKGFEAVRRIVGALLRHNAEVGYSSGLVAMAAFLVAVYGLKREEEAFWVLTSVLEDKLFNGTKDQLFFWSKVQEEVLGNLIIKKVPKVHQHLKKLDCSIAVLTDQWFNSLFVMSLPAETVTRVWDCLLCEGPKVLLRVAIALVKKCQSTVALTSDVERMSQIVTYKLRRVFDANELMEQAFKKLGSMKSSQISAISWKMEQLVERKFEERARLFANAFDNWEVCEV